LSVYDSVLQHVTSLFCAYPKKNEDLIYTSAEAWNHTHISKQAYLRNGIYVHIPEMQESARQDYRNTF